MCLLSLAVHKKDTLRLKEEIELVSNKPDIAELLWYTIEVRGLDLRPEEQKIKAKGELFIFVLYTAGMKEVLCSGWSTRFRLTGK